MSQPFISVIIAVKNGERTIGKYLDSVVRLDYPVFETIVVNDGSTDRTALHLRLATVLLWSSWNLDARSIFGKRRPQ